MNVTERSFPTPSRSLLMTGILSTLIGISAQGQSNNFFRKTDNRQTMTQRWELDSASRKGTFIITPYKQVYVTAGRKSNNLNTQSYSENPAYSLPFPVEYNNYEARFQ